MKLKSYPEYKDSGVEWIGDIPKEWNVEKLKFNSTINKESLPENKDPDYEFFYLDISNVSNNGKILNIELMRFKDAPSRARRIPNNHDTIISTVRTYLKSIAYLNGIPDNFIVSTGFSVLNPERNMFPRYLYYLVSSDLFIQTVVAHSKGIAYPAINSSDLANLPIWYPDFETQNKISSFLDKKTSEIDLTIEKDQRLIELLKEKRTALINHVVTKGLDPTAEMKESGVEWIGEIPENWTMDKFRRGIEFLTDFEANGSFSTIKNNVNLETDNPFAWYVRATDLENNRQGIVEKNQYCDESTYNFLRKTKLFGGELLIAKRGEIGKVYLMPRVDCHSSLAPNLYLIKLNNKLNPKFTFYWFLSSLGRDQLVLKNKSTTIGALYKDDIKDCLCVFPPLKEQKMVVNYLDKQISENDRIIDKIHKKIAFLEEYKKSLIHHVVTGKIDVGEVVV